MFLGVPLAPVRLLNLFLYTYVILYNNMHWNLPGRTRSTSIDLSISHAMSEVDGPVLTKILITPSSSFVSGIIKLLKIIFGFSDPGHD